MFEKNTYFIFIYILSFISISFNVHAQNNLPPILLEQMKSMSEMEQIELAEKYGIDISELNLSNSNAYSELGQNASRLKPLKRNEDTLDKDSIVDEDENSDEESVFQSKKLFSTDTEDFERFGLSIFNQEISTFSPVDDQPVPRDYILGAGDYLTIQFIGSMNNFYEIQVNRDGGIVIESIGLINVAGLTFEKVSELIESRVSNELFGVSAIVSVSKLRAMNIFMAGEVAFPGMYSVSSLTNITQALYQAGGISENGSLRNIQVLRNNKVINTFDAYDLLLYGNSLNDIRLLSGDVVLIPPFQRLAKADGEIKRKMLYELVDDDNIKDLISMAGGYTQKALPSNAILITKPSFNSNPKIIAFDLNDELSLNYSLGVDDILIVGKSGYEVPVVSIIGAVSYPGVYPFVEGSTAEDLINFAGGFKNSAFLESVEHRRLEIDKNFNQNIITTEINFVNQNKKNNNLLLKSRDHITVREIKNFDKIEQITLSGEVRYPGSYNINSGDTLASVVERAGGLTSDAFIDGAVYKRKSVAETEKNRTKFYADSLRKTFSSSLLTEESSTASIQEVDQVASVLEKLDPQGRIVIDLDNILFNNEAFLVEDGDSIFIPKLRKFITITGEINNPNSIIYEPTLEISDYLRLSGGLNKRADSESIYIIKADGSTVVLENQSFNPFGRKPNIEPGDTIIVPVNSQYKASLENWTEITQIIYQSMVSLAAVKGF